MKLENQVCTLKQSREFDGYGLKAESLFVWVKKDNTWRIVTRERWRTKFWTEKIYPAYTGTESGVLLATFNCQSTGDVLEAWIRADKLIHLLKEKIVTPQDLSL